MLLQYNPKKDSKGSNDRGTTLPSCITLALGVRVMVTQNLSTPLGIVNGAIGTVVGFEYFGHVENAQLTMTLDQAALVPPPLPVVLVQLDRYFGPSYLPDMERVVPVAPFETDIRCGYPAQHYKRSQLPLMVSKAITIHKSQGQSYTSVVLDPSCIRTPGMAYVAIGRARSFERLYIINVKLEKKLFCEKGVLKTRKEYLRLRALAA